MINDQCKDPDWASYRHRWLAAATIYRAENGNPWSVSPARFTDDEKDRLKRLYDINSSKAPIAQIRRPPEGYDACPMCGSAVCSELDHALPKSVFPEFSILRENLVPSCGACNKKKGAKYRGVRSPERFIHPYYDSWAADPIWTVEFGPDLDAVVFQAVPSVEVATERRLTVEYHLSNVLGEDWLSSSQRYWGTLPGMVRKRLKVNITAERTRGALAQFLEYEEDCVGVNGWHPAFLRGILADDRVSKHLSGRASALPQI